MFISSSLNANMLKNTKETACEMSFVATHIRIVTFRKNEGVRDLFYLNTHQMFIFSSLLANKVNNTKETACEMSFAATHISLVTFRQKEGFRDLC